MNSLSSYLPSGRRSVARLLLGLDRQGTRVANKIYSVACGPAFAAFGPGSVLERPVRLHGEERIDVGSRVFVGAGSWLQALGPSFDSTRPGGGKITIGSGTKMSGVCVLSAVSEIWLGSDVLLARNVYIADHQHAFRKDDRPILSQGTDRVSPVSIGDGAWLGQNVVIGPGVSIGARAVIGANSVVLSDVPEGAVAVGAPAVVRSA